jgi:hypothetical protein
MTDPLRTPGPIFLGQENPVYRNWVMLLNGYGFNWYRADNQARADDLLIRSRASEHLAEAAASLRAAEAAYRRRFIPPPSREHPSSDPACLAEARRLHDTADRIAALDTRLRGAAVPGDDKIWARLRTRQEDLLQQLCQCDLVLVGMANDLRALAAGIGVVPQTGLAADTERAIDQSLAELAKSLAKRDELLATGLGG